MISCTVAQFPITLSVAENLTHIRRVLDAARPGDLVLFPEGSLSGYDTDLSFLTQVDTAQVLAGLDEVQSLAEQRGICVWLGACYQDGGAWFNAAWGFAPHGQRYVYHKVNLATHERGVFATGDDLPVFRVPLPEGELAVGVQLCREIRFPEQWGWLARQGAQVILHLDNAVGNSSDLPVWRSHLVSRAAETQRFVLSANNAAPAQQCPTIAISPRGRVLGELVSAEAGELRLTLDTAQVSNWYLGQSRTDLLKLEPANPTNPVNPLNPVHPVHPVNPLNPVHSVHPRRDK